MDLVRELIQALQNFDRKTSPLGLYASEEFQMKEKPFPRLHQEWHLCLKPRLVELGCPVSWASIPDGCFGLQLPDRTPVFLGLARIAKIKVRKFGSAYRIDPQKKFQDRWNELNMPDAIRGLWRPASAPTLRIQMLLTFAGEAPPFGKELAQLQEQLAWEAHGVEHQSRVWEDLNGRAFHVGIYAWSWTNRPLPAGSN